MIWPNAWSTACHELYELYELSMFDWREYGLSVLTRGVVLLRNTGHSKYGTLPTVGTLCYTASLFARPF
jgi:hypothetical protein